MRGSANQRGREAALAHVGGSSNECLRVLHRSRYQLTDPNLASGFAWVLMFGNTATKCTQLQAEAAFRGYCATLKERVQNLPPDTYMSTGRQCVAGHFAPRYKDTKRCLACEPGYVAAELHLKNRVAEVQRSVCMVKRQHALRFGREFILGLAENSDLSVGEALEVFRGYCGPAKRMQQSAGAGFYIGKPCKLCSSDKRYVSTNNCVSCAKAYASRQWREKQK